MTKYHPRSLASQGTATGIGETDSAEKKAKLKEESLCVTRKTWRYKL